MKKEEKIHLLKEAQNKIEDAIADIKTATDGDIGVKRYLVADLEQAISNNNEWLGGSNPKNIQSLIDDLK